MDPKTFLFQLTEALDGIRKARASHVATVTTVALALMILGGFLLGLQNLNRFLDGLQASYEITVFLGSESTEADRLLLQENLSVDTAVAEIQFLPKAMALEELRRDLEQEGQIFPYLPENPLPDAYRITLHEGANFPEFRKRLAAIPAIEEVSVGEKWVSKALSLVRLVRMVGLALILVLGGASMLIVSNTIALTIHARRDEIEIMKLVGATDWFIRVPFLIEGFLHGLLGGLLGIMAVLFSYFFLVTRLHEIVPELPLIQDPFSLAKLSFQLILMGTVLGLLGALTSLRRIRV